MKGKLDETPFQTDIQQSYGGFDVRIRFIPVENSCNLSFRFELNSHQWKSTPSRFDNSPPMQRSNVIETSPQNNNTYNSFSNLNVWPRCLPGLICKHVSAESS